MKGWSKYYTGIWNFPLLFRTWSPSRPNDQNRPSPQLLSKQCPNKTLPSNYWTHLNYLRVRVPVSPWNDVVLNHPSSNRQPCGLLATQISLGKSSSSRFKSTASIPKCISSLTLIIQAHFTCEAVFISHSARGLFQSQSLCIFFKIPNFSASHWSVYPFLLGFWIRRYNFYCISNLFPFLLNLAKLSGSTESWGPTF